jgi:lipid A 4'-phosphatase
LLLIQGNMPILRQHVWKFAFLALAVIFLAIPSIDLWASSLFFRREDGFFLKGTPLVESVYQGVNVLADVSMYGLGGLFILSFTPARRWLRAYRAPIAYLLLVLLLGPGLLVNGVLKQEIGRARPDRIVEFGGAGHFTPAFVPADECPSNCAFVSGHAAMAFYPLSLAFVFPRRRRTLLAAGIVSGTVAGAMRIAQGKHFLSDVVFAFFAVYIVAAVIHYLFQRLGWLPVSTGEEAAAATAVTETPA